MLLSNVVHLCLTNSCTSQCKFLLKESLSKKEKQELPKLKMMGVRVVCDRIKVCLWNL